MAMDVWRVRVERGALGLLSRLGWGQACPHLGFSFFEKGRCSWPGPPRVTSTGWPPAERCDWVTKCQVVLTFLVLVLKSGDTDGFHLGKKNHHIRTAAGAQERPGKRGGPAWRRSPAGVSISPASLFLPGWKQRSHDDLTNKTRSPPKQRHMPALYPPHPGHVGYPHCCRGG